MHSMSELNLFNKLECLLLFLGAYSTYSEIMAPTQYLALLRGINVGGNNIIKMADLRAFLEKKGYENVRTYIQSGNILFRATGTTTAKLTKTLEKELSAEFDYTSRVVVLTKKELDTTVQEAPKGFGAEPEKYRYDVIFLKPPLTAKKALEAIETKEGVDTVRSGTHALYFSRLISQATQSRLSKIVALPLYKNTTIRNWRTTTKLLEMMHA